MSALSGAPTALTARCYLFSWNNLACLIQPLRERAICVAPSGVVACIRLKCIDLQAIGLTNWDVHAQNGAGSLTPERSEGIRM
ncbi:hypothetical protein NDU88_000686 [Pleurodeles waltl]|uniref:Uncharacterized protein n=1 Tax=Pleurodeles waltl TaxID=8319 RepID=A0AAV7Q3K7_PLEWA|nr:hypothetical protein NDU88_000686 [Pleurodeles waltl]